MEKIFVICETVYVAGEEYYENSPYPTFPHKKEIAYFKTTENIKDWFAKYLDESWGDYEMRKHNDGTVTVVCQDGDEYYYEVEERELMI